MMVYRLILVLILLAIVAQLGEVIALLTRLCAGFSC